AARAEPIKLSTGSTRVSHRPASGDYVSEMARRIAVEQFGENAYQLGIRVITTVNRDEQIAAQEALRKGVLDFDKRRGYRGPEAFLDLDGVADEDEERLGELLLDYRDF